MEIIIKPTEACNGTCVYCSADGSLGKLKILPQDRLGRLFDIFVEWMRAGDRRNLRFLWHGGEPMLCGPDYYLEIMRQQQRAFGTDITRVRNAMQSNLSLVDDRWIPVLRDLLKDQAIGTSFDIVDGVRGLAGGKDLRQIWVRAVNMLRQANIRVGVVYVAHRKSLDGAGDIYRFFRNIGLHVRVNPLYREGRAGDEASQPLWITADEYGRFLVDLCEIWRADDMRCSVMPLMEWYRAWKGSSRLCCDSRGMCHTSHLGINPDGAVFGCGRQSDHRANLLGNIFEDNLDELLRRREQGALADRSQRLREGFCRDCRFWHLCHGGCPMMGLLYHGDMLREEYFCAARKRLYEHFESLFGPPVISSQQSVLSDQQDAPSLAKQGVGDRPSGEHSPRSAQGAPSLAKQGVGDRPSGEDFPRSAPLNPACHADSPRRSEAKAGAQRGREPRTLLATPNRSEGGNPRARRRPAPRFVVTIERPEAWSAGDTVRIVTSQPDLERLLSGRLHPHEQVRILVGETRFTAAPGDYSSFSRRLTMVAESTNGAARTATLGLLRDLRAELVFSPATIGDGSPARQAADAGVPVRLDFSMDYDEHVLTGLLDHFLHSPNLQVPIEPFYALAGAVARHRKLTLWQVFDSSPGRCFFVDAERRISLSPWWARQAVFFGTLADSMETMCRSAGWAQLEAYAEQVFISQTPCAFCEHYPYCGGIWRAASDSDKACLIWQRLMDRIVDAYRGCVAGSARNSPSTPAKDACSFCP